MKIIIFFIIEKEIYENKKKDFRLNIFILYYLCDYLIHLDFYYFAH